MIILDIEASGTEPHIHSIVSIGAIDFKRPANRFYGKCRIWEGAHIMDGALEVNGFTEAEITDKGKQTEGRLAENFLAWAFGCEDRTLVGQNPSFDRDFLRAACARKKLNWTLPYRTLDTHTMCYMHMIKNGVKPPFDADRHRTDLNLDAILNYCGIPEEPHPHQALTGAMCHAEVASRLLYDKKLLLEFNAFDIPWIS